MKHHRRLLAVGGLLSLLFAGVGAARGALPTPEPNIATTVVPAACSAEAGNPYEAKSYGQEGWSATDGFTRYGADCQRLHFTFGPIHVKPGQNDVLIQPVTIEKPAYDGYMVRMRPDLVNVDGTVPPIEQVHLHHGTWLTFTSDYSSPWFASGEEKTIGDIPRGYGMPIKATDDWELLYMVHNATAQPREVYITYDIDFVPKAVAESKWKIQPAYPIWLDVGSANEAQRGYPVFNVQRGFGDPNTKTCTWPAQNCSAVDPMGDLSPNNGTPTPSLDGSYFRFPAAGESVAGISNFQGGTLVAVGGHLHPGGISDDIDLVRGTESRRIFTSVGHYWDRTDNTKFGGPPTSWDLSMTLTSLPRWGIDVKPGDRIRINATYDTSYQSTYEDMGIAIAYIAPHNAAGQPTATGLDPFAADARFNNTDTDPALCLAAGVICTLGEVTHGHMAEAGNFGGPDSASALSAMPGQVADTVHIGGFLYTPGDLTTISFSGVPTVPLGNKLEFVNEDMAIDVYHTATSCQFPCTGATGTAFPLANDSRVDFDSAELGYSPSFGPAKNSLTWDLNVSATNGFAAGQRYTYYCRIHPFMRGAFEVTG